MHRWVVGIAGVMGIVAVSAACGSDTACESAECAGPVVGNPEGGDVGDADGGPDAPKDCKPEVDAKDAPACVVDGYGIFVDAQGSDANPGTKAAPVKTFAAALSKIGNLPRIYVCEGTYAEHVKLTRGISVYGGFACGAWTYSGGKSRIAPSDVGFALHIAGVTTPVVVADLELVVQPGTKSTPSGIGAFVARSTDVTMRRMKIAAGTGFTGANGEAAKPAEPGTSVSGSMNGIPGTNTVGGGENVCTCSTGGTSTGARGGDTGAFAPNGGNGAPAYNPPIKGSGTGQTRAACEAAGAAAQPGSDAPPAADASPPFVASIGEDGLQPGHGEAGKSGTPGQGGGGAGSYTAAAPALNGGGGGGGCGGCGGGGGGGGAGGGSSLAVLSLESRIKLEASALAAANAGNGGSGAAGESGGAAGGKGNSVGSACPGASGGTGGNGGSGAGGSGGISAGILHKGVAPTLDAATEAAITFGTAGDKGVGGTPQTNDGEPGGAKKVFGL